MTPPENAATVTDYDHRVTRSALGLPSEPASAAHRHLPAPADAIAQAIRVADGQHKMGAGALGEVAVNALRDAGYTIMRPVCEACDDD